MDTCKRMWSENQIGEIAKENAVGITGVKIEYLEGVIEDGVVARIDFSNNYQQPYVIVSPTAPDPTPMLEMPAPVTKTLFGNKSVLGEGNIDLYRHNVQIRQGTTGSEKYIYTSLYSSKKTNIDSITDLKTMLNLSAGETYPAHGLFNDGADHQVMYITPVGANLAVAYMTGSLTTTTLSSGVVTDTIKTI